MRCAATNKVEDNTKLPSKRKGVASSFPKRNSTPWANAMMAIDITSLC
jgi:hypothetical protein